MRSSAAGDTWDGYDPLEPASPTNQTNLILALLLNPGRANGGALARLADVAGWFGIDTVTPPAGAVPGAGIRLNTLTVDATWAYQARFRLPRDAEPVLRCELAVRVLPTNLLGGFTVQGSTVTTVVANLAAFLAGSALGTPPDRLGLLPHPGTQRPAARRTAAAAVAHHQPAHRMGSAHADR